MSSKGRRFGVLGKKFVVNFRYAGGVRKSPGVSDKNHKIGECARGKDTAARKACFKTHASLKNKGKNS